MQKTTIPFSQTNNFSKLISDYITGANTIKKYFSYAPSINSFQAAIEERKKKPVNRQVLVVELEKQYEQIIAEEGLNHEATRRNIQLLLNENTFTVTTGQQLNIFTGPLYFIYKILTVINLSEKLTKEFPKCHFVPVFWMATEDHDYDEIKNILVYGKKIAWDTNQHGAVGRFKTEGFEEVIKQIEEVLDKNQNANDILKLARDAYVKYEFLADATRAFVHSLFSKYGLVIIDGDSIRLKNLMIPFFEKEVKEQVSFNAISKTNLDIQLQYGLQVQPREINLFYLMDNARNRISFEDGVYKILNTKLVFTESEMLLEIKNNPAKISPNVILRPMYQETILPNLAYIGGPAEVHYWFQFKGAFDAFGIFYPVILLRNCIMLLNQDVIKKISKLNLQSVDLFLFKDELIKKYLTHITGSGISFERSTSAADKMFDEISTKVSLVDPTLKQTVEAEKAKFFNSLKSIEAKVYKAQKIKEELSINQINKLRDKFFPDGSLQEREENILQYISQNGISFIDDLKNNLDPVPKDFLILEI